MLLENLSVSLVITTSKHVEYHRLVHFFCYKSQNKIDSTLQATSQSDTRTKNVNPYVGHVVTVEHNSSSVTIRIRNYVYTFQIGINVSSLLIIL